MRPFSKLIWMHAVVDDTAYPSASAVVMDAGHRGRLTQIFNGKACESETYRPVIQCHFYLSHLQPLTFLVYEN